MAVEGLEPLVPTAAGHAWVGRSEGLKQGGFVREEVVQFKLWLGRRGRWRWMDVVRRVVGTLEFIWVQEAASILLGGRWTTLVC
jgi:hypothetical protein